MVNNFGNKRIAKNTIIVYLELFVTMAVNLLTARFVLQALGASDYGLYNVVGGVIAMFTFISNSMSRTTIRFLNYEMGRSGGDVNRIFNQSNVLHILFAVIIFILLESIGVYYITNYLNVDAGKEEDAMFVFQVSTIVTCIGITNVPFRSIFIAHERFMEVAIVDILNVLVKFLLVISLLFYRGNALRFYALLMSVTTFLSFIIYHWWAAHNWPGIVRWHLQKDWHSYKDQLFFSNWNLLKTASMVARNQGAAILINLFFGTAINAAYAIAYTVQQQIIHFVGKFDAAVAPQITQNLGAGNVERAVYLASHTCRMCVLLMEIAFWGLYVELEFVLSLWLGDNIPVGTIVFCRYTLFIAMVASTSGGLVQLINGYGRLKWFMILMFVWYLLSLFAGYCLFRMAYPAYVIVLLFVISDVLHRISEFYLLGKYFGMDVISFVKEAYWRPFVIFLIMLVVVSLYPVLGFQTASERFVGIMLIILCVTTLNLFVGLKKAECAKMWSFVLSKYNAICK